jgi:hypothetical protein
MNLDNEVKRTRELLLMIPDDVLQSIPSLTRCLLKEIGLTNSRGKAVV